MNKALLAILLIALVGTAATQEIQEESKLNIDLEQCFLGAAKFAHEVKAVIAQTKAETISVQALLETTYAAAETFNPLLHACSIDLKIVDKIDSFTFNNTNACFSNVQSMVTIAKNVTEIIKQKEILKDIIPIIQGVKDIIQVAEAAKATCEIIAKPTTTALLADGFELNFNLFKCIKEAQDDLATAKTLFAEITNKNSTLPIEDLFEQTINLYNNLTVTVKDCGVQIINLPTIDNVSELKSCVKDVHELSNLVITVYTDIKGGNIKDLFNVLKNIYQNIQEVKNTCVISKPKFLDF